MPAGAVVQDAVRSRWSGRKPRNPARSPGCMPSQGREKQDCQRCHVAGNQVGAAAMVLPGRVPVHAVPRRDSHGHRRDHYRRLGVFLFGVAAAASVWLTGRVPGREGAGPVAPVAKALAVLASATRTVFSRRAITVLKALVLDGILQRRLLKQSRWRWAIHSAIFLPFVFRFAWGIAGLIASHVVARSTWYEFLLNNNDPATALLFDLTGILVVNWRVGGRGAGHREKIGALARPAPAGLCGAELLGGVVIVGFVLEGMRIAMTASRGAHPGLSSGTRSAGFSRAGRH